MKPEPEIPISCEEVHGEVGRFLVQRGSRPPHLVDILANGGLGQCACTDYRVVCTGNLLRNGGHYVPCYGPNGRRKDRTACVHLAHVRDVFMTEIAHRMALAEEESKA